MDNGEKNKPELSIVICTHNRARHLERALKAWAAQEADPSAFEVLVVDNGSTDDTAPVCRRAARAYPGLRLRYLYDPRPSLSRARNIGMEQARGTYIAYIDDDADPNPYYVKNFLEHTRRFPRVKAFGGPVLPKYETGSPPPWMSKYIRRLLSIVDLGHHIRDFAPKYPVGCNMLFRRDIFDRVGPFELDDYRSEDKHMFYKIRLAGERVLYLPDIPVRHFVDAYRFRPEYIRKVSYLNGVSDRVMLRKLPRSARRFWTHLGGLIFKLAAALILWAGFALKGRGVKGRALFEAMWHNLRGFLSGKRKD